MVKMYKLCALLAVSLLVVSCTPSIEYLISEGKYKEAEAAIKKKKGFEKYDYAELLINEYIELEEYGKAIYVYEKITPEHCSNSNMRFPSLYCHGAGENYERPLYVKPLWQPETMTKSGNILFGILTEILDMMQRHIISL